MRTDIQFRVYLYNNVKYLENVLYTVHTYQNNILKIQVCVCIKQALLAPVTIVSLRNYDTNRLR